MWCCLLSFIAMAVLCSASSAACTLQVPETMITRLLQADQPAGGCAAAWDSLLSRLEQMRHNLTGCSERETTNPAPPDDTRTNAPCQLLLDELQRKGNQTLLQLDKEMASKALYERIELAKVAQDQDRIQQAIETMRTEQRNHRQQLLLLYLDAADLRQALHQYQLLVAQGDRHLPQQIVKFVYAAPRHENRRLENLLDLVRQLPARQDQRTLYQLLQPEIMKRPTQNQSTLAMLTALEMGQVVEGNGELKKQQDAMYQLVLKRWMFLRLAGQYREIVQFATKHPRLFEQIGAKIATIDPKYWWKFSFTQFVTYPNLLPLPEQRLEAFRTIMKQLKQRNGKFFADHLAKLAPQIERCEQFLRQQKKELEWKDELVKLKRQFADFDRRKDYAYYLKNSKALIKKYADAAKQNKNRQPGRRGGLAGRR